MSSFTLKLKTVIDLTGGNIGLDVYPIFDEEHRETLNKKIVDRYLNREIGQETVDMFIHALKRKMNEIMPIYNKLYEAEKKLVDPFITVDVTTTTTGTATGLSEQETASTENASTSNAADSKSRAVQMDTPQQALAGNADYASAAQDNISHTESQNQAESESTGTGTASTTSTQDGSTTQRGYTGSQAELLLAYRNTLMNIDVDVIDELEPLFMQVWSTGEEFFETYGGYRVY